MSTSTSTSACTKLAWSVQAQEMPPDTGPWQPQPCDKALTVALAPHLALETRSAARARFDAEQEEKALQAQVLLAGLGCG